MTQTKDESAVTVLFVDDEEALLRSIARVLERSVFVILTAQSSEKALELLRSRRVDVLVSDIDMPGMDGIELLRVVRREHPNVIRMLLTGAATLERALNAINEGEVSRFFSKPFDITLFRESMASLGERIQRRQREGVESSRRVRQDELQRWLDNRFRGLMEVERSESGEVVVDVMALTEAVERTGSQVAMKLLGGEE